jgi:tryptophan halogenase
VAIGLSSGFVEPLESTGIFFIHHAIEQLAKHFPDESWNPVQRKLYNDSVAHVMDGVREFLVLHYVAAKRNDTQYWRDAKTRRIPEELAARIETWKNQLPDSETVYPYYHGLPAYSYMCVLLGMGGIDVHHSPALSLADPGPAEREFAAIRDKTRRLTETLPKAYDYFAAQH